MIVEKVFYLILIIFAFMTVHTSKLRRAVVFLAVFSASSAFVYVLLGAPDAALAEAVIGSTLATIIYLATLQKYRVFTIYYTDMDKKAHRDIHISRKDSTILSLIEGFCFQRELEPQVIYTVESLERLKAKTGWDIIVRKKGRSITVHGKERNYHVNALKEYINGEKGDSEIRLVIE
jgi:putative multicomponent Na+:H+ antiporter subunit B